MLLLWWSLFVNHMRKLSILLPGLPTILLHPTILHLPLLSLFHPLPLKLFRRSVNHCLLRTFAKHPSSLKYVLLSEQQCGSRSRCSTRDLLALVSQSWSVSLHSHGGTHLVSLDNSKSFNPVCHETAHIRILFVSVRVDGVPSQAFPVNAGIPQATVSAPTLFP